MTTGVRPRFRANRYLYTLAFLTAVVGMGANAVASWAGAGASGSLLVGLLAAIAADAVYFRLSAGLRGDLARRRNT